MLKDEFTHLTDEEAVPYKDAGLVSGGSATSETVAPKNDAPQTGEAETGAVKKKAAK
ncbi:hypothetical protein [Pseudochrobactrum asaccharolyticum]|uniref:Uncharacterized protein n=1 Tax=Pseudochrobactrum asaccharolyticum TaxID=354351 RepID=A0A366DLZ1_9HYPH|nr:hypothetical protein [Pseudochrobactrum asaccharolyticum]MBX8803419.1 hypothetical protein [Ochrobactrum sp. MR28]MBX8819026.1 hypothetical protein [Ochrobactrum sp. MR31]RBO90509.1 hypothetical protein DFR47_11370 [Pseudochrobactrum asaccharolyticum]